MKHIFLKKFIISTIIILFIFLAGCSTFSVKAPAGMFVSTGDYVPEVKTMGILQSSKTVLAFLYIYDLNAIRKDLYEDLIVKTKSVGADGITNIQFYWKLSFLTYFSTILFSGVFDFYMEGVAIKEK